MYFILLTLNFFLTLTFLFLNHPMSMGLILLMQTILISLISGMFSLSYWFSYMLFLVMVGGMLILFIYMTSLASNEMFNFSMLMMLMFMAMFMVILMIFIIDNMMINSLFKNINMMEIFNKSLYYKNENLYSLKMIYNNPNYLITIILINYLFLTLIAVVKITSINYGPLRQKF